MDYNIMDSFYYLIHNWPLWRLTHYLQDQRMWMTLWCNRKCVHTHTREDNLNTDVPQIFIYLLSRRE